MALVVPVDDKEDGMMPFARRARLRRADALACLDDILSLAEGDLFPTGTVCRCLVYCSFVAHGLFSLSCCCWFLSSLLLYGQHLGLLDEDGVQLAEGEMGSQMLWDKDTISGVDSVDRLLTEGQHRSPYWGFLGDVGDDDASMA